MTRGFAVAVLSLVVSAALLSCARSPAPQSGTIEDSGRRFVDLMAKGDFATAAADFDPTMKQALPADKLKEAWAAIASVNGAFRKVNSVRTAKEQGFDVAYVNCEFATRPVRVKVVFNSGKQVSGLWFLPGQ